MEKLTGQQQNEKGRILAKKGSIRIKVNYNLMLKSRHKVPELSCSILYIFINIDQVYMHCIVMLNINAKIILKFL